MRSTKTTIAYLNSMDHSLELKYYFSALWIYISAINLKYPLKINLLACKKLI